LFARSTKIRQGASTVAYYESVAVEATQKTGERTSNLGELIKFPFLSWRTRVKIKVKLFGTLSKSWVGYDPAVGIELEVQEGTTVRDVTKVVQVSEASIGIVTINGKMVRADTKIMAGDEIKFFQPIAGG
jgi:molybdopterin converting factor small subunit